MIEFKLENLPELRAHFDPAIVERAVLSMVNKTAAKAKTDISKGIRSGWAVSAGDINKKSRLHRARRGEKPRAQITYAGPKEGLIHFKPKRLKSGFVTVKVLKRGGRARAVHAKSGAPGFIATANKGTQIFARTGEPKREMRRGNYIGQRREPIEKLAVKSIPEMVSRGVIDAANGLIRDESARIFANEMDFFLGRKK